MLDLRGPILELSESLGRARHGDAANAEVVRWLRAVNAGARLVSPPADAQTQRGYTRTLVHKTDLFEILVLHWRPGCVSVIHDHGGAHCWFAVSQGIMEVENYLRTDGGTTAGHARIHLEGRERLTAGEIDYRSDDVHLHRCIAADEPVTTLHVYSRPIGRFQAFDERAQTCAEITTTYDAIAHSPPAR